MKLLTGSLTEKINEIRILIFENLVIHHYCAIGIFAKNNKRNHGHYLFQELIFIYFIITQENKRLEKENHRMKTQNGDLQRSFVEMQRQVEEASHLHAKVSCVKNIVKVWDFNFI